MTEGVIWRHCSICKAGIGFTRPYFVCSVTTCNRKRNPLYFCSLGCWEAHVPMMRHRDAWAEEATAPTEAQWQARLAEDDPEDPNGDDDTPRGPSASETDFADTTGVRRISEEVREAAAEYQEARRRRIVASADDEASEEVPQDVLVVVSKLKKYVKARSGMNTSDNVVGTLSDFLRKLCNEAIRNAARDGRKTVMDRDFEGLF